MPNSPSECAGATGDAATDLALVTAALAGDAQARDGLANRMLCIPGQVRIRMRRYGIRPTDDEVSDISQEIFAAIWERLERYRGDCPLEGWAYGFVARITLAAIRKNSQRRDRQSSEDDEGFVEAMSKEPEGASEAIALLLPSLRPQEERVIQLRYFEGLGYEAMAEKLSCTERAARARCQRAMDRLRELAKSRGIQKS